MPDLPTGTVTFLYSDIEGSTQLLLRLGDAYARVLGEHQHLMRQAFAEHGGFEVDTQGDSFFVAFPTAASAVAAAAAATRTLAAHPWPERGAVRVRIGLHTGAPQRVGDRYVGIDVHRAARIAAAGHGGQILLSEATRMAVAEELPEGATLRPLGAHWLKDLPQPEPLAQLVLAGLPSEFPDLKTLDRRPDHLPTQPTPFVGRGRELAEIQRRLETPDSRLLTLVGPGGIGKTRLAIEAAQRNRATFAHGAHFVPLATIPSPEALPFAIGDVLEFSFPGPDAPVTQLLALLRDKTLLLVLDNFEHLVGGASLLADLLAGAPQLKVLVTSRERLNLQGEWVLPVESIEYPDRADDDRFGNYAAVQLFTQGALRVQPAFALMDDAPCVLRICQLVEGLPLAIELAAAWVRLLPCSQVAARLASSLDFLTSRARDVPERHRSLRAAFDQSWGLLTPAEQTAYAKLSVFHGPFDLEAAEAVGEASVAVLASLSDKSLLRADIQDGQGRYVLHEVLRQYAAAQLAQVADESSHRERAITYLKGAAARLAGEAALRRASGLLTQAIAIADDAGRADLLGELRHARGQTWMQVGAWVEARPDIVAALESARPDDVDVRVKALLELGEVEFYRYDVESGRQCVLDALEVAETVRRADLVAGATVKLGFIETNAGHVEDAVRIYERALAQGANAHSELGRSYYWLGRYPEAVAQLRRAIASKQGGPINHIFALQDLGLTLAASGQYVEAIEALGQAEQLSRELEAWPALARAVAASAGFHLDVFDYAGHERLAEQARAYARAADFVLAEVSAGLDLLFNHARRGDAARAAQIVSEVAAAVAHAQGSHGWLWRLRFAQARAELAFARGEWEEALRLAESALQHSRDVGRIKYQALAFRTHGQALAALGRGPEAHSDLRNALDVARGTGDPALFVLVAATSLGVESDDVLRHEAHAVVRRISAALPNDEMRHAFESAEPVRNIAALPVSELVAVAASPSTMRPKRRWWPWGRTV